MLNRRILLVLFVSFAALGAIHAEDVKVPAALLGKWEKKQKVGKEEVTITLEFARKNLLKVTVKDLTVEGRYTMTSDTTFGVKLAYKGQEKKEDNVTFAIKDNELILSDSKNNTDTFTRVKSDQ